MWTLWVEKLNLVSPKKSLSGVAVGRMEFSCRLFTP